MTFEEWWKYCRAKALLAGCSCFETAELAWHARDAEVEALKARVAELEELCKRYAALVHDANTLVEIAQRRAAKAPGE